MPRSRPVAPLAPIDALIGQSPLMHTLRTQISHLAAFDGVGKAAVPTVLLQGDTGTGKGLVARLMHDSGPRARGPFVEVNCAALPDTLLEAELFGFEAGAFSDAKRPKPGLLEAASGGTLFLDEVDALPLTLQGKLLTALESKRVRRLGAIAERPVDVKLIAATQMVLSDWVAAGRFRADLYHRLAVIVLQLPPLHERAEDILLLAQHFWGRWAAVHEVTVKRLSAAAAAWLRSYDWPGNVRELSHLLERVTLLSAEAIIDADTLARLSPPRAGAPTPAEATPATAVGEPLDEAARIRLALQQTRGNVLRAARLLGLSRSTLRYRMVRCGVAAPRHGEAGISRPTNLGAAKSGPHGLRGGVRGGEDPEATVGWQQMLVALLAVELSVPLARVFGTLPFEPWALARCWARAIGEKVEACGGVLLERHLPPMLAAFGLPQTLDQLPKRAVQAALAIRQLVAQAQTADGPEMAPEVRQAVYLGPLLDKEQPREISVRYAAAGETLSVAVRLLGHVGPGEVLVCGQIGQLLSGWCELQACELPQEVGIPHRMRAFRVGARCHSVGRGLDPAHDS